MRKKKLTSLLQHWSRRFFFKFKDQYPSNIYNPLKTKCTEGTSIKSISLLFNYEFFVLLCFFIVVPEYAFSQGIWEWVTSHSPVNQVDCSICGYLNRDDPDKQAECSNSGEPDWPGGNSRIEGEYKVVVSFSGDPWNYYYMPEPDCMPEFECFKGLRPTLACTDMIERTTTGPGDKSYVEEDKYLCVLENVDPNRFKRYSCLKQRVTLYKWRCTSQSECPDPNHCPEDINKDYPGECGCGNPELISITPDVDYLSPGQFSNVRVLTAKPSRGSVNWSIVSKTGSADAKISPENGPTTTIYEVSGEGEIIVRATSGSCVKDTRIRIGCQSCADGMCSPGSGEPKLKSIDLDITLGKTKDGRLAGHLQLKADTVSPELVTPQALKYNTFNTDSQVFYDNGTLRQIIASDTFVDIVTANQYKYAVNFYRPADLGAYDGNFYAPATGATPFVIWTIENPDASDTVYNKLRISEERGGTQKIHDYIWDDPSQTWSLSKGNGLQVHIKKKETIDGNLVVTDTITDNQNIIASKTKTTWHTYPWGDEIIEEITDPDGATLTTVTNYYENAAENGYGEIKSQTRPDGSSVRYEYNGDGLKSAEINSWLDLPVTADASAARTIYYDYTPVDSSDSNLPIDAVRPRTVTETIGGITVAKTFYSYSEDSVTGERTEIIEQATSPTAAYGDTANLRTITVTFPYTFTTADSGKVKSITYPDGRLDTHTYEYGTYTPAGSQPGTFAPGHGDFIKETVTHGTVNNPEGIANQTTREVRVSSKLGDLLLEEISVYTGSGFEQVEYTVREYDDDHHVTDTFYSDGSHSHSNWNCCNKYSDTDRSGIVVNYPDYDVLNRLKNKVKTGYGTMDDISTSYTYDGMGRRLSETVSGGGLSYMTSTVYDIAGRIDQTTDKADLITYYDYSPDNLITTVTRPGDATQITENYPDGQLKSVTGSAVVGQYYTYGANPDGTRWSQVNVGSPTSPRWEKTTTDMLGRTIKVERSGYLGVETSESFYNDKGQLARTTVPGQADTLYGYNELGVPTTQGLDVDMNGILEPASDDRITNTNISYVKQDGNWYQASSRSTYAVKGDGTPTTLGTSKRRLTGLGTANMVSQTITTDIHGNETVEERFLDPAIRQETRQVDHPGSTIDSITVMENGLPVSSQNKSGIIFTFDYDPLGRRTEVTDPRIGTTITHYNNLWQIDYIQDPAGHKTNFGYDPLTGRKTSETNALNKITRFKYDDQGHVTHTWGDGAYPVRYEFDTYGQMEKMHTYRGGSSWENSEWPESSTGTPDTTTYHYQEASGLLEFKEDASGKGATYIYLEGGRLYTRTWARDDNGPLTTTYGYDPATGELTTIDYSDDTADIVFTYDRLGRQGTITDAVGTRTFGYNPATLHLETETISGLYSRTITRLQDPQLPGRDGGFTTGNYSTAYGYEPDTGRFKTVSYNVAGKQGLAEYSYLTDSDLLHTLSMDKRQTIYNYEEKRNLIDTVTNSYDGSLISGYDYENNEIGQRTSVTNSGPAFHNIGFTIYDYNDRRELTQSDRYLGQDLNDRTNPVQEQFRAYHYDLIGNRTQSTEGIDVTDYTPNNLNQYDTLTGAMADTPDYDADGNLTGRTNWQYSYNGENRLVSAEPKTPVTGDSKTEFLYDYMGRRVQKKVYTYQATENYQLTDTIFFLYDNWNLIEEIPGDQFMQSRYFVWGLDLSSSLQGAGGIGGLLTNIKNNFGDYDLDGDIDGADLQELVVNRDVTEISAFSSGFGKTVRSSHYLWFIRLKRTLSREVPLFSA